MKIEGITLVLGSHAHVPSGAFESEFEYIYEKRMRPFVSNLYRYSNINAVLHYLVKTYRFLAFFRCLQHCLQREGGLAQRSRRR